MSAEEAKQITDYLNALNQYPRFKWYVDDYWIESDISFADPSELDKYMIDTYNTYLWPYIMSDHKGNLIINDDDYVTVLKLITLNPKSNNNYASYTELNKVLEPLKNRVFVYNDVILDDRGIIFTNYDGDAEDLQNRILSSLPPELIGLLQVGDNTIIIPLEQMPLFIDYRWNRR